MFMQVPIVQVGDLVPMKSISAKLVAKGGFTLGLAISWYSVTHAASATLLVTK